VKPRVNRKKKIQAPAGAVENKRTGFLPPLPGLGWFGFLTHGWRRGLLSDAPPALPKIKLAAAKMKD
jgi:hypothetical protein